jgi:molecular chaperone GrpE
VTDEPTQTRAADQPTPTPAAGREDSEVERLRGRWLRARADLENYRKRSDREVERRYGDARDRLLLDWLEVVDDVDRALRFGSVADPVLRPVQNQMQAVLRRHGVERMEAKDTSFDPELHEAAGTRETEEAPPNTVVDVVRAGYRAGDRVLRPARVIVSKRPSGDGHGDA